MRERLAEHVGLGRVEVHTLHAFGLRLLGSPRVAPEKAYRCWRRLRRDGGPLAEWLRVRRHIDSNRHAGVMPDPNAPRPLTLEDTVLVSMLADRETLDTEDGIYHCLHYGTQVAAPGYDLVLVDEAQDLNDANHAFLRQCVAPAGFKTVICAVGDPAQAVYQFRGATPHSLARFGGSRLPLTCCFRCPRRVVAVAAHLNPSIRAVEGAPVGQVRIQSASTRSWVGEVLRLAAASEGTTAFVARGNASILKIVVDLHGIESPMDGMIRWAAPSVASQLNAALGWRCESLDALRMAAGCALDEDRAPMDRTVVQILDAAVALEGEDGDVETSPFLRFTCQLLGARPGEARLVLSTIHASKGAEYDHVMPGERHETTAVPNLPIPAHRQ